MYVAVNASVPAKNAQEFIRLIKASPGTYSYGSSGNGTVHHLVMEMIKSRHTVFATHIPYNGSGPAVAALLSEQVGLVFSTMPAALPQVKAGKLRALAVTTLKRNGSVPEVPTMAESGVPNFDLVLYSGIMGPAGMQKPVVDRLYSELVTITALPEMREVLAQQGAEAVTLPPDQFAKFIRSEIAKLGAVVKASGAKVD
jgi:tripartite-type tricarboxylate transporter receptor subunit TctC